PNLLACLVPCITGEGEGGIPFSEGRSQGQCDISLVSNNLNSQTARDVRTLLVPRGKILVGSGIEALEAPCGCHMYQSGWRMRVQHLRYCHPESGTDNTASQLAEPTESGHDWLQQPKLLPEVEHATKFIRGKN